FCADFVLVPLAAVLLRPHLSLPAFILAHPKFFFFNDPPTTEISTLSLHDALPIWLRQSAGKNPRCDAHREAAGDQSYRLSTMERSEEHTSELQSLTNLVCRLLLEKKKKNRTTHATHNHTHYWPRLSTRSQVSHLLY